LNDCVPTPSGQYVQTAQLHSIQLSSQVITSLHPTTLTNRTLDLTR
jgi:hypothetical protein